ILSSMNCMVRPLRLLGGWVTALFLASAALAAPSGPIESVRVGVGNGYKIGHWTPVWIMLQAKDEALRGELQIIAPDGDDVPATFAGGQLAGIDVPPGASRTVIA